MSEDHQTHAHTQPTSQNLIAIGIGVVRGSSQPEIQTDAVQNLVTRALHKVEGETLPVRFALLFATADWCRTETPLPAQVRSALRERLGYEVPLIGGSTALLYCSTEEEQPFFEHGMTLLLYCTNEMWMTVSALPQPYAATPKQRRGKLNRLARELEDEAGIRLGASANKFLFGYLPGLVADARGQCAYFDHELHQDILDAFGHRYLLFGASATSKLEQSVGYQFANDECLKSGLVMGLIETDLCLGAALAHGFEGNSRLRVSVDELADADGQAAGYDVTKLDGKSVAVRLKELEKEGHIKLGRPVFGLRYGADYNICWSLPPATDGNTRLRLKRKVVQGDNLYLLDATPKHLLEIGPQTVEHAIERSSVEAEKLNLFLCFSCGGRLKQYEAQGIDWKSTVEAVHRKYPNIPFVGVVSAGEFGIDAQRQTRANNMSLSVICQANTYWRRAWSRNLQRELVRASSHLLECETPKQVMEAIVKGAVEAGASGGKVNVVDHHLGRILCQGFGYAWSPPGSEQKWEEVAKITDYPIPVQEGGDFPQELRANAMPVVPDLPPLNYVDFPLSIEGTPCEDILEVAMRTRHAVFISNCRQYVQYGLVRLQGLEDGNISSELVIPLIGSGLKVIAIVQLSFPDDRLDRESQALWIGYTQQAAAALEHAEESEQRKIVEEITELSNRMMHAPLGEELEPHDWCQEYIEKVVELLEADGGHIRTLRIGFKDDERDEYRLRGKTGMLADLLQQTRFKIYVKDDSFRKHLLDAGPVFKNTRAEVIEFNRGVRALENADKFEGELIRRLDEIKATTLLPLSNEGRLLGSLVIDSRQEYFFTTRRCQIAKAAAEQAGALLQAKRTEYFSAHRLRSLEGLAAVKNDFLKGSIPNAAITAAERLQSILKRVCHVTGADVGSIFTWHEDPRKLLLHSYHNWYQPMVGEAEYGSGEGWTGSLVEEEIEITILAPGKQDAQQLKRKYHGQMIPPMHSMEKGDARIGVRLKSDEQLIGVMTLLYYQANSKTLDHHIATIQPFLQGIPAVVALGLEAVLSEMKEERTRRFFAAKDEVFDLLIDRQWQQALAVLRKDFQVERVTLYHWRNSELQLGWSDQAAGHTTPRAFPEPLKPIGALRELIEKEKNYLLISSLPDERLQSWPNHDGVRNLLAVPLETLNGEMRGVLEFVNQQEGLGHPYEPFGEVDRGLALDIARPFAGTIQGDESNSLRGQLATATKIGARGLFSAIVMHQVLSPFTNMRGTIDWLLRHPDSSPEERANRLRRIETFYNQALETIQRAGRRGGPGKVRPEKLHTLVREAFRFVEPEIAGSRVKVKINNELRVMVVVDLWAIVGALINLVSNALDATEGAGVLSISTSLSDDERTAFIRIHNTCAVAPTEADIARYFHPGHTEKGGDSHLGLGLPLAKQAIESAGGTLLLRPASEGVEAIVALPVANQREPRTEHA